MQVVSLPAVYANLGFVWRRCQVQRQALAPCKQSHFRPCSFFLKNQCRLGPTSSNVLHS